MKMEENNNVCASWKPTSALVFVYLAAGAMMILLWILVVVGDIPNERETTFAFSFTFLQIFG